MSMLCCGMVMLRVHQVTAAGFYLVVEQMEAKRGNLPASGFLMEFNPEDNFPWRNDRGCGDWGSFDGSEWFFGPVEWSEHV